ncbi:hypothetical protein BCR36DRAFT_586593 [Piromyces finnis]|uniref:Uncharacterized protein n=1 Tax=Piromyces finnis TaxID=1754191 RepID=A0A1Y1UZ24_9FUNG|nr:hypothetical protein BCR36DRAFT_586593 [Piromyces finnis]|eukprot:ORX43658.1 hypothetical protein BCR36DRAFT_586593 [Piromyces finnis]
MRLFFKVIVFFCLFFYAQAIIRHCKRNGCRHTTIKSTTKISSSKTSTTITKTTTVTTVTTTTAISEPTVTSEPTWGLFV